MLTKEQLENYTKDLKKQHIDARKTLKQAKANLHAVVGAQQAVAHLLKICEQNEKADGNQPSA